MSSKPVAIRMVQFRYRIHVLWPVLSSLLCCLFFCLFVSKKTPFGESGQVLYAHNVSVRWSFYRSDTVSWKFPEESSNDKNRSSTWSSIDLLFVLSCYWVRRRGAVFLPFCFMNRLNISRTIVPLRAFLGLASEAGIRQNAFFTSLFVLRKGDNQFTLDSYLVDNKQLRWCSHESSRGTSGNWEKDGVRR